MFNIWDWFNFVQLIQFLYLVHNETLAITYVLQAFGPGIVLHFMVGDLPLFKSAKTLFHLSNRTAIIIPPAYFTFSCIRFVMTAVTKQPSSCILKFGNVELISSAYFFIFSHQEDVLKENHSIFVNSLNGWVEELFKNIISCNSIRIRKRVSKLFSSHHTSFVEIFNFCFHITTQKHCTLLHWKLCDEKLNFLFHLQTCGLFAFNLLNIMSIRKMKDWEICTKYLGIYLDSKSNL
jgi:hypothetical protein